MAIVLVVDDDPLQRNILTVILSDEGYETYAASSGKEALRVAKTLEPDVVLTDLWMGDMDGDRTHEKTEITNLCSGNNNHVCLRRYIYTNRSSQKWGMQVSRKTHRKR